MKYGLFLTTRHTAEQHPHAAVQDHLDEVRLARNLGYDSVFAGHHFLPYPLPMVQLWTLLGRIAAESGEMQLGTGILLLALLNPVEVAEQTATLDAITNGRFVLGAGVGYRREDLAAFGLPPQRMKIFEGKLDVVRRLLEGERVTAEGPGYALQDDYMTLPCVQRPRVPIWMAATNDSAVMKAARWADTWMISPLVSVGELERQVALFREARGGTMPDELPIIREACVAPTDEEAFALARQQLERRYRDFVATGQNDAIPASDTMDRPWEQLHRDRFIIGSPDTVVPQLQALRDRVGATHVLFRPRWAGLDPAVAAQTLTLLAREVIPRVG